MLGLGMAISVAPLTTIVMGAVDRQLAGTASGINNAVARVAGLVAIAVLGMVMVGLFSHYLNVRITGLGLPADLVRGVQSNEIKLASVDVPEGLDSIAATKLRSSIEQGFVFGFRFIMLICAGLCVVSSSFAWRMIGTARKPGTIEKSHQIRAVSNLVRKAGSSGGPGIE
jgi:hypothetical protein